MKNNDTYHPITNEIRDKIKLLLSDFSHSALGTINAEFPMVTKVVPMILNDEIYLLLSDLSEHTRNISDNNRCSVYFAGVEFHKTKMNNPRVTFSGTIEKLLLDKSSSEYQNLLSEYCKVDSGAQMWGMFGDFNFYKLTVSRTLYVEGFAKAYVE
jgi:putative heme iron utilization protein